MTTRAPWRENAALAALVLVGGVFLSIFSEHIFAGGGLGYDGCSYGAIITRYEEVCSGGVTLNSGLYFRLVPALAVRGVMQILGVPLSTPNVIVVFQVVNVFLLTAAAWLFGRCADLTGLGPSGKWLGCIGLFCNYAVLKYNFYYPVLLDTASLALGVLLAWLYLSRRTWWLPAAGLAAFFIAPNVGLQAFLLFLLPPAADRQDAARLLPRPAALTLAALAVLIAGWVLWISGPGDPLAVALLLAAIGGGVYCLTRAAGFSPDVLCRPAMLLRLGLVAGLVVLLTVLPHLLPALAAFDWFTLFFQYARTVLLNGTVRPGEFLVAHTLYFGPIILVSACLFAPLCRAARRLGGGWLLVLAFGLLQSLNPLSRQMVGILPFLVLPACLALAERRLPWPFVWGLAAASLACSKVWQRINAGADFSRSMDGQPEVWARYLESTGNWMLTPDYRRQGLVILAALVALIVALVWMRRTSRTSGA